MSLLMLQIPQHDVSMPFFIQEFIKVWLTSLSNECTCPWCTSLDSGHGPSLLPWLVCTTYYLRLWALPSNSMYKHSKVVVFVIVIANFGSFLAILYLFLYVHFSSSPFLSPTLHIPLFFPPPSIGLLFHYLSPRCPPNLPHKAPNSFLAAFPNATCSPIPYTVRIFTAPPSLHSNQLLHLLGTGHNQATPFDHPRLVSHNPLLPLPLDLQIYCQDLMLGCKILTQNNVAVFTKTFIIFPEEQIVYLSVNDHTTINYLVFLLLQGSSNDYH